MKILFSTIKSNESFQHKHNVFETYRNTKGRMKSLRRIEDGEDFKLKRNNSGNDLFSE